MTIAQKSWLTMVGTFSAIAIGNASSQAQAVSFNFSYDPGTSLEQIVGFETAGNVWASYLTDDVTINLHVGVSSDLPGNAVAGALPAMQAFQSYESFYNSLKNDKSSWDDTVATTNLQAKRYKDGNLRYEAMFEQGEKWYNKNIALTNANAKALGMLGNSHALDGSILMRDLSQKRNEYTWNYDYTREGSADEKSLDFLSVALHEIGHTLGFVSGIDSAEKAERDASYSENIDRLMNTTSLDMFRYSSYSKGKGQVDLASGVDSYFSIDGGSTRIADFARGKKDLGMGADGFQGSHWEDNKHNPLGIMSPTIRGGERRNILELDLRALDVIGWDINQNTFVDLDLMERQAKQSVAQKISDRWGWNTAYGEWIDDYIRDGQNYTAADWIARDRIADLDQMIADSELYEIGYGKLFQEAFLENAYHSTLETSPDPASVPEPSTLGLLGLAAFALKRLRRGHQDTNS